MTTNEWVAVFVGIVTAITTVVGGFLRSSRAAQLRKAISEDQAIVKSLAPERPAKSALLTGIDRQSAELAAIVLHPMRASVIVYAFVAFLFWGVVLIVYLTEGPRPLTFAEGPGRGLTNWGYLLGGIVALTLCIRDIRRTARARSRERDRLLNGRPTGVEPPGPGGEG
ncbi:hypothetical protein ACLQ2Q_15435 [Microbacterium sp. DT81.1]|uniref:hypothetical protein n=1 Tax=Microbacterium sp. DT81.1 TaxID=3393413 RepID=UPI003CFB5995